MNLGHATAPRLVRPLAGALALAALAGSCRCGEPAPERVWEVGVPLPEIPAAVPGALVDFLPAGAPLVAVVEKPAQVLEIVRATPSLAAALDPRVLAEVALSDSGAAARAVRQRLNELSTLSVPEVGLEALLDGPLVVAARQGPRHSDVLMVKRLSKEAQASWKAAQMLQAVSASLSEVRIERYRGFPLRKVLVGERRRVTYVLLRDLLVAGTSDEWVKASLDLALGGAGERASSRPAVRAALAEERGAPLVAVLDADALRAEPGSAGPATLALTGLRWLRASLSARRGLSLTALPASPRAAREARPAFLAFAPRTTLAALDRSLSLSEALTSLLPEKVTGRAHAEQATALRERLVRELAPLLADEAFWLCDRLQGPEEDGSAARHVVGFALRDGRAAASTLAALAPDLLAGPLEVDKDGPRQIFCSATSLCLCVSGETLLASTSRPALKAALAVADARAPALSLGPAAAPATDLVYLDAPALASAIGHATGLAADEPLLALLRGLGPLLASLRPSEGKLVGEVGAP